MDELNSLLHRLLQQQTAEHFERTTVRQPSSQRRIQQRDQALDRRQSLERVAARRLGL